MPLEANQKHDDIFASIIPCHHKGKSSRGQLKNQMPVEKIYIYIYIALDGKTALKVKTKISEKL